MADTLELGERADVFVLLGVFVGVPVDAGVVEEEGV